MPGRIDCVLDKLTAYEVVCSGEQPVDFVLPDWNFLVGVSQRHLLGFLQPGLEALAWVQMNRNGHQAAICIE